MFVVISYGDDGEPDVRCIDAGNAEDAAAVAFVENGGLTIHGVYPGYIGHRIDIPDGLEPEESVARYTAMLRATATEIEEQLHEALEG